MAKNCKIQLVLKSKKSAKLFQSLQNNQLAKEASSPYKLSTKRDADKFNLLEEKYRETQGLKMKIVSQLKKEKSLGKTFKNVKIRDCIIAPCETPNSMDYQYCYTFENVGRKRLESQELICQGKKAECIREEKSRLTPAKDARTFSRQSSEKSPRLKRPRTSEYLSHKKEGFVELEQFQRKKPWSMNPFHYQAIYMEKLKISLDFYFKVQFANRVSVDLSLNKSTFERYKVYVGPGNNQFMVQQILRKRFWYELVHEPKDCDFYWTQNQMKRVHDGQHRMKRAKKWQDHEDEKSQQTSPTQSAKKLSAKALLNNKILPLEDSKTVQRLIDSKGYQFVYPQLINPIITNHIPGSELLNQRKNLLKILQDYYQTTKFADPWTIFPKTFLVSNPTRADMHFYTDTALKNKKKIWIIKPGERSNYQNDIEILPASKVMDKLRKLIKDGDEPWSFLLQEYIQRPFLYKGRKFDLRHFVLVTSIGGGLRAYWYYQGYVRTCTMSFKLADLNPFIHLTSDTLQETSPDYGKHQLGNKLTYNDFERYLQTVDPYQPHSFQEEIIPQMKAITNDLLLASYKNLDPKRRGCNFELIGLDFLMDENLKVILTGVNTNPSLRSENPVIGKIIPSIVEQSLELSLDPFLPPRNHFPARERLRLGADPLASLRFECIFDQFQLRH